MQLLLIIEKADEGYLGRVEYDDNLIVDEAETISELETNLKKALSDYHQLTPNDITFEHEYDVTALFEKLNYLKISTVAEIAGINPGLLRQYTSGVRTVSPTVAQKIQIAIQKIANELQSIHVYSE